MKLFPSSNQSVPVFGGNTSVSSFLNNLTVTTSPTDYGGCIDISGFITKCPTGFVRPDHPDNPDNEMVDGTGCAVACRFILQFLWE